MKTISLCDSWRFAKLPGKCLADAPDICMDGVNFETVSLPHTWYRDEDQYRGLCVYEKELPRPDGECLFLSFDAADQNCAVYCGSILCGTHKGGYSRFRLPIPKEAEGDLLKLSVFVENPVNEDICPSFGDFTVFGGLYRGADLLICGESHFDRCWYGTDGLILRSFLTKEGWGHLSIEPHTVSSPDARIHCTVLDPNGTIVCEGESSAKEPMELLVPNPVLWNGRGKSFLYTVKAELLENGEVKDVTGLSTGFRRIEVTPDQGLFLNGNPYRINGVAKHQDFAGVFNAVTMEEIRRDFERITEIGANAVRLSHYQHPQAAYDFCDTLGLLAWAEIPMLKMTESPALMENTEQQLKELILQNIHHPSVFCWGIQNEIAMFRDAPFMHDNCRKLHAIAKKLDPDRATACANLYPLKASSRLNEITYLVGYNIYFGWYYGDMTDYGPYLDKMHASRQNLPLGISEYGVDTSISLHSSDPHVKDYSEEYQLLWHRTVYPQIESRRWLWGSFIWNMFDFSSARRDEGGQKYINAKGLVTHDRKTPKDAFYYYKAKWSDEPFVHLCGRRYAKRAMEKTDIIVCTNQPEITLSANGKETVIRTENGTAVFKDIPLQMGENFLKASSGDLLDEGVIERVETEPENYRLPDQGDGAVRNWFLAEDSFRKEGFFSLEDTANDLLENPRTREILRRAVPELFQIMTEKNVIPLGLTMKNILSRDSDGLDLKALNSELNEVPNEE